MIDNLQEKPLEPRVLEYTFSGVSSKGIKSYTHFREYCKLFCVQCRY